MTALGEWKMPNGDWGGFIRFERNDEGFVALHFDVSDDHYSGTMSAAATLVFLQRLGEALALERSKRPAPIVVTKRGVRSEFRCPRCFGSEFGSSASSAALGAPLHRYCHTPGCQYNAPQSRDHEHFALVFTERQAFEAALFTTSGSPDAETLVALGTVEP